MMVIVLMKTLSKEKEMESFIKCYNHNMKKHKHKHSDINLINFKKSHSHKKKNNRNEDVTYFECEKSDHYRIMCSSLNKHNKKVKDSYKMKSNYVKGQRPYIAWEEDESSSPSLNSRSDDECTNSSLMIHKKSKDTEV